MITLVNEKNSLKREVSDMSDLEPRRLADIVAESWVQEGKAATKWGDTEVSEEEVMQELAKLNHIKDFIFDQLMLENQQARFKDDLWIEEIRQKGRKSAFLLNREREAAVEAVNWSRDWDCKGKPPPPRTPCEMYPYMNARPGPRDRWRDAEDAAAVAAIQFDPRKTSFFGPPDEACEEIFGGVELERSELEAGFRPRLLEDYPVKSDGNIAEKARTDECLEYLELHRMLIYDQGDTPGEVATFPSLEIIKPDKIRVVAGFSCKKGNLNSSLASPKFCMDSPESMVAQLSPNKKVGGCDIVDCFPLHVLAPATRRLRGLRIPAAIYERPDYVPNPLTGWNAGSHPRTQGGKRDRSRSRTRAKSTLVSIYLTLPQGIAPAPYRSTKLFKAILRRIGSTLPVEALNCIYIDDIRAWAGREVPPSYGYWWFAALFIVCDALGLKMHDSEKAEMKGKIFTPTTRFERVGTLFDTRARTIQLGEDRTKKVVHDILELAHASHAEGKYTAKALSQITGKMQAAAKVIRETPVFARPLYKLLEKTGALQQWSRGNRSANPKTKVTRAAKNGIHHAVEAVVTKPVNLITWSKKANKFVWSSKQYLEQFGAELLLQEAENIVKVTTDASKLGIGAWALHKGARYEKRWAYDEIELLALSWKPLKGLRHKHINVQEMAAVLLVLIEFPYELFEDKILWQVTDNKVELHYIRSVAGRIDELSSIAKQIHKLRKVRRAYAWSSYLEGLENVLADGLSGLTIGPQQKEGELCDNWILPASAWRKTQQIINTPLQMDLFASAEKNTKCAIFADGKMGVFAQFGFVEKHHKRWFAFPPNRLVNGFLKLVAREIKGREQEVRPFCILVVKKKWAGHNQLLPWFKIINLNSPVGIEENLNVYSAISRCTINKRLSAHYG